MKPFRFGLQLGLKTSLRGLVIFLILAGSKSQALVVTPSSVRIAVTHSRDILQELNKVHSYKDQVNIARGSLLPSVNLDALVSVVSPTLLTAEVESLLPFLIPSRWFDYAESRHLLEAERYALLLVKLNLTASSLSLYSTLQNDESVLELHKNNLAQLEQLVRLSEARALLQKISIKDLQSVRAQRDLFAIQVQKIEELVVSERSTLREVMNLPRGTLIERPASYEVPPSEFESQDIPTAAQVAFMRAPELKQFNELIEAAKNRYWSRIFGFFSGAPIQGYTSPGSPIVAEPQANLGFSWLPFIRLSSRDLIRLHLQVASLQDDTYRLIETQLTQLSFIGERIARAQQAIQESSAALVAVNDGFNQGFENPSSVIGALNQQRTSQIELLAAVQERNLVRLNLHRLALSNEFSEVNSCELAPEGWSHRKERHQGIEEGRYCSPDLVSLPKAN